MALKTSEKKREIPKSRLSIFYWFHGYTSIGGLCQHHATIGNFFKCGWLFLLICGFLGTMVNIVLVFFDWSNYPVITTVRRINMDNISFPGVTICNSNLVHCGNLHEHLLHLNDTNPSSPNIQTLCEIFNFGNCFEGLRLTDILEIGTTDRIDICQGYNKFKNIESIKYSNSIVLLNLMNRLPEEDKYKIAHQPNKLIRTCYFRGIPDISCREFMNGSVKLISPAYGVCYSYNFQPPDSLNIGNISYQPRNISFMGESFGLDVVIDTESSYGLWKDLTDSTGIRLVLHRPKSYPMVTSQGHLLKTHTHTLFSLELSQLNQQEEPYESNCSRSWGHEKTFDSIRHLPYQSRLCMSICLDDVVQTTCNCTFFGLIEINRNLSPACDGLLDQINESCILKLLDKPDESIQIVRDTCLSCQPECEEEVYKPTISQSTWPSSLYWPVIASKFDIRFNNTRVSPMKFINQSLQYNDIDTFLSSTFSQNSLRIKKMVEERFLKFSVFFESKIVTLMEEEPKYTWNSFMNSIGGGLSLYLGISLVSFFELIELVIRLVLNKGG